MSEYVKKLDRHSWSSVSVAGHSRCPVHIYNHILDLVDQDDFQASVEYFRLSCSMESTLRVTILHLFFQHSLDFHLLKITLHEVALLVSCSRSKGRTRVKYFIFL